MTCLTVLLQKAILSLSRVRLVSVFYGENYMMLYETKQIGE